jgi:hypothetical protein
VGLSTLAPLVFAPNIPRIASEIRVLTMTISLIRGGGEAIATINGNIAPQVKLAADAKAA